MTKKKRNETKSHRALQTLSATDLERVQGGEMGAVSQGFASTTGGPIYAGDTWPSAWGSHMANKLY